MRKARLCCQAKSVIPKTIPSMMCGSRVSARALGAEFVEPQQFTQLTRRDFIFVTPEAANRPTQDMPPKERSMVIQEQESSSIDH